MNTVCVMVEHKQFQDHFLVSSSFTTVALLLFSLLFAYVSHHICLVLAAAPPHYPILPISFNSLDLAGVRLPSPRDSQILPKPVCRCRCYRAGDANKLKEELDEDLVLCVVSFQLISSGAQLGSIGGPCHIWVLLLFWLRSRALIVSG